MATDALRNDVVRHQRSSDPEEGTELPHYPILKSISEPHKITSAMGFSFEMRQIYIIATIVIAPVVLYQLLFRHIYAFTTAQGLVIVVPLAIAAVLCAFVTSDGREFYWWFYKRFFNTLRKKTLVWRSREPRTAEEMRDSVQAYFPAEEIYYDLLKCKGSRYVMALRVEPVSLSLASRDAKRRVHAQLAQAYDRLDFPVVEFTRSKPGNVASHLQRLKEDIEAEILANRSAGRPEQREQAASGGPLSPGEQRFLSYSEKYLSWMGTLTEEHDVYERASYVLLPYTPSSTFVEGLEFLAEVRDVLRRVPLLGRFFAEPSEREVAAIQKEAEKAHGVLMERAAVITDSLERMGAEVTVLEGEELLNLVRDEAGGRDLAHLSGASAAPPDEEPASVYGPITLEADPRYASLTDEQLGRVYSSVQRHRKSAPPAVAIGELSIADKVCPEIVKVHESHCKVNDTYHATLFVSELPDRVYFGILDDFLRMEGNVRLVKYINPLPKEKADRLLSRKISQLIAAEGVTGDSDVRDAKRREIAQQSAEAAHDRVLRDEESYHELSMIVHCEADSLEELRRLVEKARTKLKGARCTAKLAREEAFEGWVSAQPLGKNHLTRRHCTRGILTRAMACLFPFGQFKLDHPEGVLYGIEREGRSPVIVDSRLLTNQHAIVLGSSGMGKSFLVKALSTRRRMRGESVVLIDPEGQTKFDRVAREIGGEYVVLGQGSPHKINPLEIRDDYMSLSILEGADETEDEQSAIRRARAGAFDAKIGKCVGLIEMMSATDERVGHRLDPALQGKLERVFVETYAEKGITRDPSTHHLTPPTMPDFFRHLARAAEHDEELASLRRTLYQWEHGTLREVFDSQTNVDLDDPYLVLQVSAANRGRAKVPIMYAVLDYLSGRLSNPFEPTTCYVDEFWSLLKFPLAADLLEQLWRAGRARNTSMVAITQDIEEFLSSERGETIMKLSATKLLLGQNRRTVNTLGHYIGLSSEQKETVATFGKGEALLCVDDDKQIAINVVASEYEQRLFNTDPRLEAKYQAQEAAEREALQARESVALAPGPSPEDGIAARSLTNLVAGVLESGEEMGGHGPGLPPSGAVVRPEHRELSRQRLPVDQGFTPPPQDAAQNGCSREASSENGSSHNGSTQEGSTQHGMLVRADTGQIPVGAAPCGTVIAVSGPDRLAAMVAFNLAGVLAAAGRSRQARVLLVDAEGSLTAKHFSFAAASRSRVDDLRDGAEDLDDYLITEPESMLRALVHPRDPSTAARDAIEATRREFDLVVAVVGEPGRRSSYGGDWLLAADRVVLTGASGEHILEGFRSASELRGGEAAMFVAPMGRRRLQEGLAARSAEEVHRLPAATNKALLATYEAGEFAAASDEYAARSFVALAAGLVGASPATKERAAQVGTGKEAR